jgi:molybdopterin/thiamine biosynthesis adenylyltransferase
MDLSKEEKVRYTRHLMLPDIGEEGQLKLKQGKVLIVGAGGLGSPASLYLAAAGVGTIGLIDGDAVDRTNLQRQVIHSTDRIGMAKVDSAANTLTRLNPNVKVVKYHEYLTVEKAVEVISNYDFVIDATDRSNAKFMINDACVISGKPYSHGGVKLYEGHTFTYVPGSACLRCLFNITLPVDQIPASSPYGLFGVVPGILGTIQAAEAIKYLTGVGQLLTNRLLRFDAQTMQFSTMRFSKQNKCLCHDIKF